MGVVRLGLPFSLPDGNLAWAWPRGGRGQEVAPRQPARRGGAWLWLKWSLSGCGRGFDCGRGLTGRSPGVGVAWLPFSLPDGDWARAWPHCYGRGQAMAPRQPAYPGWAWPVRGRGLTLSHRLARLVWAHGLCCPLVAMTGEEASRRGRPSAFAPCLFSPTNSEPSPCGVSGFPSPRGCDASECPEASGGSGRQDGGGPIRSLPSLRSRFAEVEAPGGGRRERESARAKSRVAPPLAPCPRR